MADTKFSSFTPTTILSGSDILVGLYSGGNASITYDNLYAQIDPQPHTDNLDAYSNNPATSEALFLLNTLITPSVSSYLRINTSGLTLTRTPTQVLADISAQPRSGTLDALAATTPSQIGLNYLELTPGVVLDSPTAYYYSRIYGGSGNPVSIRSAAQTVTDIGAMPLNYLATAADIIGARVDDSHVPSTLALEAYVNARIGSGVKDVSDDTVASATSLNLDATDGAQVDVTGTTAPTTITLAEGEQKIIRFKGVLTITPSATILTPNGTVITTAANSFATFIGKAGGVVQITNYYPTGYSIHYGGDFYTGGTVSLRGGFRLSGTGSGQVTLDLPAGDVELSLPQYGGLALESGNYSTTSQAIAATTRTYITGSAITIPVTDIGGMKIGQKLSWKFNMTKTAAGIAASTIDICFGTSGTTADTARLSFTKPGGSAVVDEGFVIIEAICRGPLSASGVVVGEFTMYHNLASTGHMTIPVACQNVVSSAFDVTTSGIKAGICITTGSSDAVTIQQVSAQLFNA